MVDGRSRPTSTFSNSSQHNNSITIIKWNPYGKRIITGDKRGQVCVWNVDPRGTLSITKGIYRKKGEVTAAVFCTIPNKSDHRKAELKHNFFFGMNLYGYFSIKI
jgi:WD40 repeat protein